MHPIKRAGEATTLILFRYVFVVVVAACSGFAVSLPIFAQTDVKDSSAYPLRPGLQLEYSNGQTVPDVQIVKPWTQSIEAWQSGRLTCTAASVPDWSRLSLEEALSHHLCNSPQLSQALANVAEQAAGVIVAEESAGPQWSARGSLNKSRQFVSSSTADTRGNAALGFSWVFFDFGLKRASLMAARHSLRSFEAGRSAALVESTQNLLTRYLEAVVAEVVLGAATEMEATATLTEAAALARYEGKVGSRLDRLQAQTALYQATVERIRARSQWENARGNLALTLGGGFAQPLVLVGWEKWMAQDSVLPSLDRLVRDARQHHPRLRSVRAQIDSLKARLDAVKAEGFGAVTLDISSGTSRNWGSQPSQSTPSGTAVIQANFPLFNKWEIQARQAQVLASISAQEAEFERIRRETEAQLLQAYDALVAGQKSMSASESLVVSADDAYRLAIGRYRSGVGSILELLNTQTAVADARRQRISVQVEQIASQMRIDLIGSMRLR